MNPLPWGPSPSRSPYADASALARRAPFAGDPPPQFLRYPDVSHDQIVFRSGGDLYLVPREGGHAERLTSGDGAESLPKFSPDGQTVAFMAGYDGGSELYTLPVTGGVPTRLTWHPRTTLRLDPGRQCFVVPIEPDLRPGARRPPLPRAQGRRPARKSRRSPTATSRACTGRRVAGLHPHHTREFRT
ncbi:MAG: hypothetical protein R3E96_14630 [Planctomycetota bacterium]